MEQEPTPNDKLFSAMMKNSKLEMPFSDFEERTMARINREVIADTSVSTYKKLAVLFFVMGTGFGLFITCFLSLPKTLAGISSDNILLIFRVAFLLLVLTQLDNLLTLFSKTGKLNFNQRINHN